jgi:hypothetical protein
LVFSISFLEVSFKRNSIKEKEEGNSFKKRKLVEKQRFFHELSDIVVWLVNTLNLSMGGLVPPFREICHHVRPVSGPTSNHPVSHGVGVKCCGFVLSAT